MIFLTWLRDPRIADGAHQLVKAQFPESLPVAAGLGPDLGSDRLHRPL